MAVRGRERAGMWVLRRVRGERGPVEGDEETFEGLAVGRAKRGRRREAGAPPPPFYLIVSYNRLQPACFLKKQWDSSKALTPGPYARPLLTPAPLFPPPVPVPVPV